MRARRSHSILVLAALGLAVTAGGCGDDETSGTTVPVETTGPSSTVPVTTAGPGDELQAMLLTVSDLGTSWKLGSPINEADLSDLANQIAEPCPGTAMNPTIAARLAPHHAVQFEASDGGPLMIMATIVAGEGGKLTGDVAAYIGSVQGCIDAGPITPEPTDGLAGTIVYTAIALPELGDQRFAWLATSPEPAEGTWYGRNAVVQVGDVAISVGLLEVISSTDGTPTVSDAEFIDMVKTATERLSA